VCLGVVFSCDGQNSSSLDASFSGMNFSDPSFPPRVVEITAECSLFELILESEVG